MIVFSFAWKCFWMTLILDFILRGACSLKTTFVGCRTLLKSSFTNWTKLSFSYTFWGSMHDFKKDLCGACFMIIENCFCLLWNIAQVDITKTQVGACGLWCILLGETQFFPHFLGRILCIIYLFLSRCTMKTCYFWLYSSVYLLYLNKH